MTFTREESSLDKAVVCLDRSLPITMREKETPSSLEDSAGANESSEHHMRNSPSLTYSVIPEHPQHWTAFLQ